MLHEGKKKINLELGFDFNQERWHSIKIGALVSAEVKRKMSGCPIGLLGTALGLQEIFVFFLTFPLCFFFQFEIVLVRCSFISIQMYAIVFSPFLNKRSIFIRVCSSPNYFLFEVPAFVPKPFRMYLLYL